MNDLDISKNAIMLPITEIGKKINLEEDDIELYGKYKGKIKNHTKSKDGKLILVTAISPSPYGEGKTTVTIGLNDAINTMEYKSIVSLREPSRGPVFGFKGCATGGGYSQANPMADINLRLNGDIDAITSANNLLCAAVDNHIYNGNKLNIKKVSVKRCLDVNDRSLREVEINNKKTTFTITAASEIMAIFTLANDFNDLHNRLKNIIVGYNDKEEPIYAKDLNIDDSLAVILKEAFHPNLVQSLENNPIIIHGGPFANIAHGCSSIMATKIGLDISDYVITEAGFGSDLGAEKFYNIKCKIANIKPDVTVLVVTTKALKYHAGIKKEDILKKHHRELKKGLKNLEAHIKILKQFQNNIIVTLNKYSTDTKIEIKSIRDLCKKQKVAFEICESYTLGGKGSIKLAKKVIELSKKENDFNYLYDNNLTTKEKIESICKNIYNNSNIIYEDNIENQMKDLDKYNYPICIAKKQYKISEDEIKVNKIEVLNGAKMIVVYLNDIITMPGLPENPNYELIKIDEDGNIRGLS
ncbi:MAG: formate--tetrahydrofolate ligase [Bacilli bacterium]|nr:formate--tetrahydrofolate ligase [Bacilli bacterium]